MITLAKPRKLTIGMSCIQDYKGAYFTIQSVLMHHQEILSEIELCIIDNDPDTKQGKALKNFCEKWVKKVPIQYIPFDKYRGTSVRNLVFDNARTDYVLCCDSHVLFEPNAIKSLIEFFDEGLDEGGLVHGPLLMDDLINVCTHFSDVWSEGMWGQWKTDQRHKTESYFEIPAQGFGVFACRKDSWLRFCDDNRGFGGEEVCTHELYRKYNRKVFCLTDLKWAHLFRYEGEEIPYPNNYKDRVQNYFREFKRLERNPQEIIDHFLSLGVSKENLEAWQKELS